MLEIMLVVIGWKTAAAAGIETWIEGTMNLKNAFTSASAGNHEELRFVLPPNDRTFTLPFSTSVCASLVRAHLITHNGAPWNPGLGALYLPGWTSGFDRYAILHHEVSWVYFAPIESFVSLETRVTGRIGLEVCEMIHTYTYMHTCMHTFHDDDHAFYLF